MILTLSSSHKKMPIFLKKLNIKIWYAFYRNSMNILKNKSALFLKSSVQFLVHFYRAFLSSYFGGACRYYPSCSEYAEEALRTHSPLLALRLITKRILSCHPFGGFGFDPVVSDIEDKKQKCCGELHARI